LPQNRAAGHAIWWVAKERLAAAKLTVVPIRLLLLIGRSTIAARPERQFGSEKAALLVVHRDAPAAR
jgi:hypothetical protein